MIIGVDQHALNPEFESRSPTPAQAGFVPMLRETTSFFPNAAAPHAPTSGPMASPSIVSETNEGREGAASGRRHPSASTASTEQTTSGASASTCEQMDVISST